MLHQLVVEQYEMGKTGLKKQVYFTKWLIPYTNSKNYPV
jgi:hypothetical protein